MTRFPLLLACLALGAPAMAQVGGSITGELDLDPATWHVTDGAQAPRSGWHREGDETAVQIVGRVLRDGEAATGGMLTIEYTTEGNPTETEVDDFTITLTPDDGEGADLIAGPENADLEIEAQIVSGDGLTVSGSFAGRLIPGGAEDLVAGDDAPGKTIDGNFQATLPRRTEAADG